MTPMNGTEVPKKKSYRSETILAAFASKLGTPIGYAREKNGALIHQVVPTREHRHEKSNEGTVCLPLHVENIHLPAEIRTHWVVIGCQRPDPAETATTLFADASLVYQKLDFRIRGTLRRRLFVVKAPDSFAGGENQWSGPIEVFTGPDEAPQVTADFENMRPLSNAEAKEAFELFEQECARASVGVSLAVGSMALINNRFAMHGRSPYTAQYDGFDRWLVKTLCLFRHVSRSALKASALRLRRLTHWVSTMVAESTIAESTSRVRKKGF